MRPILFLFVLQLLNTAAAQPYAIGARSITFFDAARSRNIATQLYYPAETAGTDAAVATGTFPVLVFGHGFVMSTDAYLNFRDHFVPRGYILALPTTEGGFSPDHQALGLDLAFLAQALQDANSDGASPFLGHVAPATALMGHSMGGGASILGAAGNANIQAVVNFAAAETSPSAIAAASSILAPTLIFAASQDCVAPIAAHQGPIYDACAAPCKAFVNVLGGGHCYFANSNFNCNFGELTCAPNLSISRTEQQDVVNDLAGLWLDHFLGGSTAAFEAFQDSVAASVRVDATMACISTGLLTGQVEAITLFPMPASDQVELRGVSPGDRITLFDMEGRLCQGPTNAGPGAVIEVGHLVPGSYVLRIVSHLGTTSRRLIVAR